MIVIMLMAGILIGIALITVMNALMFPRLQSPDCAEGGVRVSILIPARNEARVIARSVRALLGQSYRNLEVIVLDDHSEDGTAALAREAANGDPRFRVVTGKALPPGWLGKNWACSQLASAATSDVLLFADADVRWSIDAIAGVMAEMRRTEADLLTVWPTQETRTWAERLVVPLMAFAVIAYLPLAAVHHTAIPWFAAACGQCLVFRRRAYERVGGHTGVRMSIIEDVSLARIIKRRGLRLRMADGRGFVGCRMYDHWGSVRDGFAKNILAGHGNSVWLLVASAIFHWGLFVLPWVWLGAALWQLDGLVWPLVFIVLGVGSRALSAAVSGQRVYDAILMPLSVILMTVIAARALWWKWHGGPRWKGRQISSPDTNWGDAEQGIAARQYPVSSHRIGG